MERDKRIVAVVFSEEDLLQKIDSLKTEGYTEKDIHLIAQDADRLEGIEKRTAVDTERAGSFKDRFKGFFTGDSGVREGLKSFDLSEEELKRYTGDVAAGGILIYVSGEHRDILDAVTEEEHTDRVETGLRDHEGHISPSKNEFVNAVDNNFDEQEDRFARGETFMQDPTLLKDEKHFSFTTKEKTTVERARGGTDEAEKHSPTDKN